MFSDYMRGSVRLASLMGVPAIYVWTHDSIGLGEDGPTHQPVEHLAAVRAIPGLTIVRPADANETAAAWARDPRAHRRPGRPHPHAPERARRSRAARTGTRRPRGRARRLRAARGEQRHARRHPHRHGLRGPARRRGPRDRSRPRASPTRVVSAPSLEWFAEQDEDVPRVGAPAVGEGPGVRRGGHRAVVAQARRRRRPVGLARALRRVGRRRDALPRVRLHAGGRGRGRARVDRGGARRRAPRRAAPAVPTESGTGDQQV